MQLLMTLSNLPCGKVGYVSKMNITGPMRRRLQDIGIVQDAKITCVQRSPLGDPTAFLIKGALIALRSDDAKQISVQLASK